MVIFHGRIEWKGAITMNDFEILLLVYAIMGLLAIVLWQLLNGDSITRRFIKKFLIRIKKVGDRNTLYQCPNNHCSRYFRLYQINLLVKENKPYRCPHCDHIVSTGQYVKKIEKKVAKPDKWMDSHSDCFRVSLKQYFMIQNTAKKVKRLREEEEAIKRFEEYNKLSTDMSWIEKIQKVNN